MTEDYYIFEVREDGPVPDGYPFLKQGWYFWDEASNPHGPFQDRIAAEKAFKEYEP